MKHITSITTTITILLASVTGCDADTSSSSCYDSSVLAIAAPSNAPELAFRETPFAAYISSWYGQPISSAAFAKAVIACEAFGPPQWQLTLSAYKPVNTTTTRRVVGLGGSAWADGPWLDCMKDKWTENDAIEF